MNYRRTLVLSAALAVASAVPWPLCSHFYEFPPPEWFIPVFRAAMLLLGVMCCWVLWSAIKGLPGIKGHHRGWIAVGVIAGELVFTASVLMLMIITGL